MRISTLQLYQRTVSAMLDQQARLGDTQEQLASGKRILRPSDDPSGTAQALRLKEALSAWAQFQRAADRAEARLQLEDGALSHVEDILQRARELAVRGRNDSLSDGDRAALAKELRGLKDDLVRLGNTRDAQGDYIFAGYRSRSPAFVVAGSGVSYAGDAGVRQIELGPGRNVTVNHPGNVVFMDVPAAAGGRESLFETLDSLANALDNPDDPAFQTEMGRLIDQLDTGLDHVLQVHTEVGARLNTVDVQRAFNEDTRLQMQRTLSAVEDLDYAEAVARLNRQMVGLEAAQKTFTRVQGLSLFNYL